jgi:hypothetical protein
MSGWPLLGRSEYGGRLYPERVAPAQKLHWAAWLIAREHMLCDTEPLGVGEWTCQCRVCRQVRKELGKREAQKAGGAR